jgi:large subunit ribosomal protein L17
MIHRVKEKKLGRTAAHRRAMIKNLSTSLILNKKIETTLAKAKYARPFIEKLITRAKESQDFNAVKFAETKLTTEAAVRALFAEVAPLFEKRPGGYTRIVKLPERDGDKAKMARLEFIIEKSKKTAKVETDEEDEEMLAETEETKKEVKKVKAKKSVKKSK